MNNFEVNQLSRSLLPENIKFNLKYFKKPFVIVNHWNLKDMKR